MNKNTEYAASYIIYISGGKYYAKNGLTGTTAYSGTNAATIINDALSALTLGGEVYIAQGTYPISSTLYIPNSVTVDGAGMNATILQLVAGANCNILENANYGSSGNGYITIENLGFDGNWNNAINGSAIAGAFYYSTIQDCNFQHCLTYAVEFFGYGSDDDQRTCNMHFDHNQLNDNYNGLLLLNNSEDNWIEYNTFSSWGTNALYIGDSCGADLWISYNTFYSAGQWINGDLARGIEIVGQQHDIHILYNNFGPLDMEAIRFDSDNYGTAFVTGNAFWDCGQSANNTYSVIYLSGNEGAPSFYINDNNFYSNSPLNNNLPQYIVDDEEYGGMDSVTQFYDNVITQSGASGCIFSQYPNYIQVWDNQNLDPYGNIIDPFSSAYAPVNTMGILGTTTVANNTVYIVAPTDVFVTSTGGSNVSITVMDQNGNTIISGVSTLSGYYIPYGYEIKWTYQTAPTIAVFGN